MDHGKYGYFRGKREFESRVAAVDFESFYSSKAKYSLRNMDPVTYCADPRFDAYLVSIKGSSGETFVGRPEDFCWGTLDGATLVMHNAGFDGAVINRLVELKRIPEFKRELVDTADLAAFLQIGRSLAKAVWHLYGVRLSKQVRSDMDGRTFADAIAADGPDALFDYAADDAEWTLRIWEDYGSEWPEVERLISKTNREACWRGIRFHRARVSEGLATLNAARARAEAQLPWVSPEDPRDAKPAESLQALAAHARSIGLEPPPSFNKNDPAMIAWVAKHSADHPFISARVETASVSKHISRLNNLLSLMDADGVARPSILYGGAHTLRASGASEQAAKFNLLNIPKDPSMTYGVDMRGMLVPREGCVFGIWDFSQIEARIVQWLSGNDDMLSLISRIGNIYQADAEMMGLWKHEAGSLKDQDKSLYAASKERVLGLGFKMGAAKFLLRCESKGVDLGFLNWTPEALSRSDKFIVRVQAGVDWKNPANYERVGRLLAASKTVANWRAANPKLSDRDTGLWAKLQRELERSARRHDDIFSFTLPSGRKKYYFKPRIEREAKAAVDPETGEEYTRVESRLFAAVKADREPRSLHGGVITENVVQSIARDVMYYGAMDAIVETGGAWPFLFNAYDEVIFEIPVADADRAKELIPRCLCRGTAAKTWAAGLPLEVEGSGDDKSGIVDRYLK